MSSGRPAPLTVTANRVPSAAVATSCSADTAADGTVAGVPRFFVSVSDVSDGGVRIGGADAAHLARALRARPGDRIVAVDDTGVEHGLLIEGVDREVVSGVVEWSRPATGEPRCRVLVLQALAADRMDEAVETLAEAGAAEIWPVVTHRTGGRPEGGPAAARGQPWAGSARGGWGAAPRRA